MKTDLQHLSVRGAKIVGEHKKLVIDAANFYTRLLLSPQMRPHVTVIINMCHKIDGGDFDGDCEIIGWGRANAPRHFMINVVYSDEHGIGYSLKVLAHEMVHVKQFATREVDENLTTWMGVTWPEDTNYWDQPWEVDAWGRQSGLYARFVEDSKLQKDKLRGSIDAKQKDKSDLSRALDTAAR